MSDNESKPQADVVASRCSHGGDNAVEIAARSHDSAFDKERREFWKACFTDYAGNEKGIDSRDASKWADECLEEFDKRFGETARAVGTKGENTVNEDT